MRKLILLSLLLINFLSYSQSNDYSGISIPSPNVYSFAKIIDNPINTFNGSTEITIPIYTIKVGEQNLPISLRYCTSGIKVSEESSRVGLGWNLNVGGMIMQSVVGEVDSDFEYDGIESFNNQNPLNPLYPLYPECLNATLGHMSYRYHPSQTTYCCDYGILTGGIGTGSAEFYFCVDELMYGKGKPDIFYFNFLQYSGKFFIDYRNDSIYIIDKKDDIIFNKIKDGTNSEIGWRARTPDGSVCFFTVTEHSYSQNMLFNSKTYNLSKIIFPNGEVVNFEYDNIGLTYSLQTLSETFSQDYRCSDHSQLLPSKTIDQSLYEIKLLKRIYSNNISEEIIFFYSDRLDIPDMSNPPFYNYSGDKKLDSICIRDDFGAKKLYEFNYSYFENALDGSSWGDGFTNHRNLRLKLLNFGEKNLPKYEFAYSSIELPSKQSYAQDYWGYYNGKLTNTNLCSNFWSIFHFYPKPDPLFLPNSIINYGSDRACDTGFVTAGTLHEIKYPSGCVTKINYESNQFSNYYYPSSSQIIDYNNIRESQITQNNFASELYAYTDSTCNGHAYFFDIVVPSKITYTATFNYSFNTEYADIYPSAVNVNKRSSYNQPEENLSSIEIHLEPDKIYSETKTIFLEPGKYGIYISNPDCRAGKAYSIVAGCTIEPQVFNFPDDFFNKSYGGGIRVKSVTVSDQNREVIQTLYEYSNGVLMSPLNFYYSKWIEYAYPEINYGDLGSGNPSIINYQYVYTSSGSITPLSYDASGALVGYNSVIMSKRNVSNNTFGYPMGFTKFEYNVFPPMTKPGSPAVNYLLNGKIHNTIDYSNESLPLRKVQYSYNEHEYHRYFGFNQRLDRYCGFYDIYPLVSSSINLVNEHQTFFVKDKEYSSHNKHYTYNLHNLLTKEEIIYNENEVHVHNFIYPTKTSNNFTIQDNMLESNEWKLVSKNKLFNGKLIYLENNDYVFGKIISDGFGQNKLTFLLKSKSIYPTGNSTPIVYDYFYDTNNNLNQVTEKETKISQSILWGYNNNKPVSKIINCLTSEAGFTGFENNELNGWNKYEENIFDYDTIHTGEASILVKSGFGPGKEFQVGDLANNHSGYQASVWVKGSKDAYLHIEADGWSIHNRISNTNGIDGQWHLLSVQLEKSAYESIIDKSLKFKVYVGNGSASPAYFDDLRFYPLEAQMTTYTYSPLIGITSESDNNNRPTKYEYDGFGRLVLVKDFEDNVIRKYEYNYKQ